MVQCKLCTRSFKMITNSHLQRTHGITPETYLANNPGALLYDEDMHVRIVESRHHVNRPQCAKPGCANTAAQSWNIYCSRVCAMSHRMSKNGRNEQAGRGNHKFDGGWYSIGKAQKILARERDKYTCRRCMTPVRGKRAHVHHVVPERCFDSPEEAHRLENLVTLCDRCHLKTEWETVRELYRRTLLLDQVMKDVGDFQTFDAFKAKLVDLSSQEAVQ